MTFGTMRSTGTSGPSSPVSGAVGGSTLTFSVVIPMYNEEAGVDKCVTDVCSVLEQLPYSCSLIVVDDGSRDATGSLLDALTPRFTQLQVVHLSANSGYGAAIRAGVAKAAAGGCEYVIFMDSDLTNRPEDIPKFIEKMAERFDVVKASRFIPGGRMDGVPWQRAVSSRLANLVASGLFRIGVKDCTNGFRAVRLDMLQQMDLRESGFAIIMEELFCCKSLEARFCEIPVVLTSRANVLRSTSFSYRPQTILKYLKFSFLAFLGVRPRLKDATA